MSLEGWERVIQSKYEGFSQVDFRMRQLYLTQVASSGIYGIVPYKYLLVVALMKRLRIVANSVLYSKNHNSPL